MKRNAPASAEDYAFCGINCKECDVYQHTVNGGPMTDEMLKGWTEVAQEHWRMKTLEPSQLQCKGCRYAGEDKFLSPMLCPIRQCVIERGLASCAFCPDVRSCKRALPEGLANLESAGILEPAKP